MAGMEDPITDLPPPSRLDPYDLFAFRASSPLPPPFLLWTPRAHPFLHNGSNPTPTPTLSPRILLVAISAIARHLLHHLPRKTLLASIILPGVPLSNNSIRPSPQDAACYLYCLQDDPTVVLAVVQYNVPADRSFLWVKSLFQAVNPARVLIAAGLQTHSFRGRLSPDDPMLLQLATDAQRSEDKEDQTPIAEYFPSGSLVDGLAAALLAHCQARAMKARLLILWPETDPCFLKLLARIFASAAKCGGNRVLDFSDGISSYVAKQSARDSHIYL